MQALPVAEPSKRLRGAKFREAAEAKEKASKNGIASKKSEPVSKKSASGSPSGSNVEVYIDYTVDDIRNGVPKPKTNSPPADKLDRSARKRREVIVVESSDEDEKPKPKANKKGKKKDDDYDGGNAVSDTDDSVSADESEASQSGSEEEVSEDSAPKKAKNKGKPKPKPMPKKPAATSKNSKKRKSTAISDAEDKKGVKKPKAAPKPKVSFASQDPWGLKTKKVKNDWTEMKSPPLEMFYWDRIIVDEYTYLKEEAHAAITELQGTHRWVLSGTPPIHDFASLKTIAVFLGLHLGVDDEDENPTGGRGSERTGKFPNTLRNPCR